MKLISVIGLERCDFVYYLSETLKYLGYSVLVVDNSISGDLYRSVTQDNEELIKDPLHELDNIVYLRNVKYSKETFDKMDYVICYLGMEYDEEFVQESDAVYVMPDYTKVNLKACGELVKNIPDRKQTFVIMRDFCTEKIVDRAVANYINVPVDTILGHITVEAGDMAKYLALNYNGRQTTKGLSEEYLDALQYVLQQITDKPDKTIKKMIKKG